MGNISEIQCIWLGQSLQLLQGTPWVLEVHHQTLQIFTAYKQTIQGQFGSHVGDRLSRCLMLDDDGVWRCMDLYELIEPKNSWFCGWGMMVHPLNLASHLLGKFVLLFRSAQWALTNLAPQRTHSRCIKSISQALNQLWIKTTSHLNQTDQSSALSFPLFPWQRPVILVPCMGISKRCLFSSSAFLTGIHPLNPEFPSKLVYCKLGASKRTAATGPEKLLRWTRKAVRFWSFDKAAGKGPDNSFSCRSRLRILGQASAKVAGKEPYKKLASTQKRSIWCHDHQGALWWSNLLTHASQGHCQAHSSSSSKASIGSAASQDGRGRHRERKLKDSKDVWFQCLGGGWLHLRSKPCE